MKALLIVFNQKFLPFKKEEILKQKRELIKIVGDCDCDGKGCFEIELIEVTHNDLTELKNKKVIEELKK